MAAEGLNYSNSENPDAKKWDILTADHEKESEDEVTANDLQEARRRLLQSEIEQAPEIARMHTENLMDTEKDFSKRFQLLQDDGKLMTKDEFEKWEDDFSFDWKRMYAELRKMGVTEDVWTTDSAVIEANTQEQLMLTEQNLLSSTIEASAGYFYHERSVALLRAIKDAGKQTADEELKTVHDLYHNAAKYLAYKYPVESITEMDSSDFRRSESNRTQAHNNLIKNINEINDLAKKYDTRPLTPRNFWPSDRPQPNGAIRSRMYVDRNIVAAFVDIAFSEEADRARRNQGMV